MSVEQPAAAELADALSEALERITQLETALKNRGVIARAQGMLMERYSLSEDGAFATLVRASNALNIKLVDVARTLIATGQLPRGIVESDE